MSDTDSTAISPAELQEIVRVFADSDLRELRLSVGEVELLVSRNEQVEMPNGRTTNPTGPVGPQPSPDQQPTQTAPTSTTTPAAPEATAAPGDSRDDVQDGLLEIRSPALGTFYRRPAPDQPPFVAVGTKVAVGDAVGTIEVMKMFTTVTADVAGTVTEICVEDAVLVEHGQTLFHLDPAES